MFTNILISIAALPLLASDMLKCALNISSRSFSAPEVSIRDYHRTVLRPQPIN